MNPSARSDAAIVPTRVRESLATWPIAKPLRLIQYLGSKLRSLHEIVPVIREKTPEGGVCLDLFAGTTVVGQSLLSHCSVLSNDCLPFSKLFGDVLVAGPSSAQDLPLPSIDVLLGSEAYVENVKELSSVYQDAIRYESQVLLGEDRGGLGRIARRLPRMWSASAESDFAAIRRFLSGLEPREECNRFALPACLMTGYYAGNYFGIRQAIEIDSIRLSIHALQEDGRITIWQGKALLAALMGACSRAVCTAGKHFAQPLLLPLEDPRAFAAVRAFSDRRVDIIEQMGFAIQRIAERASTKRYPSGSFQVPFEDLMGDAAGSDVKAAFAARFGVDHLSAIYADPPYTAQQYSRFYHILETLELYDYPAIQEGSQRGTLTRGLYRAERHKSVFCSKATAPYAFEALFSISQQVADCLILSYSETSRDSGNPRMIDLEAILKIASGYSQNVQERSFDHRYRKLNREAVNRTGANPERLLVFNFNSGK